MTYLIKGNVSNYIDNISNYILQLDIKSTFVPLPILFSSHFSSFGTGSKIVRLITTLIFLKFRAEKFDESQNFLIKIKFIQS